MEDYKKRQIDKDLAVEFSDLIHAEDDGFITLAVQSKNGVLQQIHFNGKDKFSKELRRCFATKSNVYMSVNSCYVPDRQSHNIRKINAIYVDIDCHEDSTNTDKKNTSNSSIEDLIYSIYIDLINTNKIPKPNIVNSTGRGIHLYWLLEPENKFKVLLHNAISRSICTIISDYLKVNDSQYSVDHAISQDIVRLMRIPGTFNQNTDTMCLSSIRHTKRYTLSGIQNDYGFAKKPDKSNTSYSKDRSNKPYYLNKKTLHINGKTIELDQNPPKAKKLYIKRMNDLEKLISIRIAAPKERWCRKRITFLYRHFALCAGHSCKEAWEMTVKLNQGFHTPLRMKTLSRLSKSAETAYLKGTYYYYKTVTIVNMLGISRKEIERLATLVDDITLRQRYNNKRRQSYGLRDENGLTQKQLKMLKARIIIIKCIDDGLSQSEIVSITGFSLSKVKRLGSELKAGTRHLKASNKTVQGNIITFYKRNFNQKYFKSAYSSVFRTPYITFLCSNNVSSLLEQFHMPLDMCSVSSTINTS